MRGPPGAERGIRALQYTLASALRSIPRNPALLILAVLALGVLLHEAGHIVAGILCGASVTDITLFSLRPSIRMSGAFTPLQEMAIALAGSGSVLAAWLVVRSAASRPGLVLDAVSCLALVELLGWAGSALSYPECPASNDAARLIVAARVPPELVAAAAILLAGAGALFHCRSALLRLFAAGKRTATPA